MDCFAVILVLIAGPILVLAEENELRLGDTFPNFNAETTEGSIQFHDWLDSDKWAILLSHPGDFLPVSTTELASANSRVDVFKDMNASLIASACGTTEDLKSWIKDILEYQSDIYGATEFHFPIIADSHLAVAVQLGMVNPDNKNKEGTVFSNRGLFIIGPEHELKAYIVYPVSAGINFDEIIRLVDSLQRTAYMNVYTPAEWKIIPEEFKKIHPAGFTIEKVPSGKSYMKFTRDPRP